MKYFSLFSGIGGFEVGIEKACESINRKENRKSQGDTETKNEGGKRLESSTGKGISGKGRQLSEQPHSNIDSRTTCVGYSEIDRYASAIYRYHFPDHRNYGDATRIDTEQLPDFDLLVAGFPCQSFSIAGKRKGMSGEDIRGTLFFEIWRIARDKRPRTLLLENVPGLLSSRNGKDFLTILASLDEIGYDVEWDCLNAKNFGVPQNRERVFIVANFRGQCAGKVFPIGEDGQWIDDAPAESQGERARIRNDFASVDTRTGSTARGQHLIASVLSARYGKDDSENLLQTNHIRRLTPTECERLMAFPDGWTEYGVMDGKKVKISDTQRYKTLGNAVVSNVIAEIIKELFR